MVSNCGKACKVIADFKEAIVKLQYLPLLSASPLSRFLIFFLS